MTVLSDTEDKLYYFSYWRMCYDPGKMAFWERIKYCWQVLRTGQAYNDELIFDQEAVDALSAFLDSNYTEN